MMKRSKRFAALILTGVMAATTLFGCGSSSGGAASDSSAADSSLKKVLKVGMECAYAPFNWTQDTDTTPDGSKAVKIALRRTEAASCHCQVALYEPGGAFI